MQKRKAIDTVKRAKEVMDGIYKNLRESGHFTDAAVACLLAEDLQEVIEALKEQQWQQ